MRLVLTTLAACLLAATGLAAAPPENPCTNGSFERLTPAGFPVDWEPVGPGVGVSKDAHTGTYSLRIVRTADAKTPITGLNRRWRGHNGQQGAMLDRRAGGIDFWYKAVSAKGATQRRVYVIPMSADPAENTGAPRAVFDVPRKHIGDGQWHNGKVAYLSIRVAREGTSEIEVDGAAWKSVRPMLRVEASARAVVRLRMRLTAGTGGQLYWTTDSSPHFAEDKVLGFEVTADGKWHEYVLRPDGHAEWKGRITAIRIDPGNGAKSGEFGIDYVRGGRE